MSVTKGLSSLRKKVSKYRQTKDYSDSNSSIVSYASDGEGIDSESKLFQVLDQPIRCAVLGLVAEAFDAPLFTPPAHLESGEVTPKVDTTQFKYSLPEMAEKNVIRPKVMVSICLPFVSHVA